MGRTTTARIVKKCPPIDIRRYYLELRLRTERLLSQYPEMTRQCPALTERAMELRDHLRRVLADHREKGMTPSSYQEARRDLSDVEEFLNCINVVRAHRSWERDREDYNLPL